MEHSSFNEDKNQGVQPIGGAIAILYLTRVPESEGHAP